ncbi:ArsR/SmtB family transcription factor [Hellea balneolensis]|uniref:ArsR/SmtB family transcription factor n=1 Tax=Hellea balneolensis TaxID=287478 RepID=UPI000422A403|nr:metalloregulator ArsR/SmtB family transcription factor [Hellea balneolensis]
MEKHVLALKTLGHMERLRILALLSHGELTVSELVQILELSQPRITQYIISLEAAGIIERLKEGSWVFSRIRRGHEAVSALVATTLATLPQNDLILMSDLKALEEVRAERSKAAEAFFANVANDRSQLGDEYLPQADIEAKMQGLLGEGPFDYMVDLGTGTGRMLEVFSGRIIRGSGIDNNSQMLKVARSKLADKEHIAVRQGDILSTPLEDAVSDLVSLHQVLHYLDDPQAAIMEAARLLKPSGQLIIVDYEDHDLEEFRTEFAHRRLGFSDRDIGDWLFSAGLSLTHSDRVVTQADRPDVRIWIGNFAAQNQQKA